MVGLRMKKSVKRRKNYLRNKIYDANTKNYVKTVWKLKLLRGIGK